jgi:hypothetical protein
MTERWTAEDMALVGHQVRVARGNRVPWKTLERLYARSRQQLWRLAYATSFPAYATSSVLREHESVVSTAAV